MEILKWLNSSLLVDKYTVREYKGFASGFYLSIEVRLKNGSQRFVREYSDSDERNYSYHWQDKDGRLIARWDNAPYQPELFNYPHHKHFPDLIEPSTDVTVEDVLIAISKALGEES